MYLLSNLFGASWIDVHLQKYGMVHSSSKKNIYHCIYRLRILIAGIWLVRCINWPLCLSHVHCIAIFPKFPPALCPGGRVSYSNLARRTPTSPRYLCLWQTWYVSSACVFVYASDLVFPPFP